MSAMNQNRLLDNLAGKLMVTCLADLKTDQYAVELLKELLEIERNIFAVHEWNEACGYFTGRNERYPSEHEARLGLMTFLSKERWIIANGH